MPWRILSSNSCCFLYCLIKSGGICRPISDSKTSSKDLLDLRLSQSLVHLLMVDIPSLNQLIAEGEKSFLTIRARRCDEE